jgi:rod shape determining protein RodA
MISLYVLINVGMAVGIVPVVGVPLPLVSYGGTSVIATFLALGILLNIQTRRFMLFY